MRTWSQIYSIYLRHGYDHAHAAWYADCDFADQKEAEEKKKLTKEEQEGKGNDPNVSM